MQSQKHRLYFYGAKEILGTEEYYFNMPRLYTAKVTSDKLRYYKINHKVILFKFKNGIINRH